MLELSPSLLPLSPPLDRELCPLDSLADPMYPLSQPLSLSEPAVRGEDPFAFCGEDLLELWLTSSSDDGDAWSHLAEMVPPVETASDA